MNTALLFSRGQALRILVGLVTGALLCGPWRADAADAAGRKTFDVREFGAKGDGKVLDTPAVQAALDACGKAGGGTVRLPAGTYLSKPLVLRDKTILLLDSGAILLATDDPAHFRNPERPGDSNVFLPFISGKNLTDIAITGAGTIDGAGARWWVPAEEARRKTPNYTLPRPRLIVLTGCKAVKVSGVTLQNSPTFHLVPTDCEDVVIDGITILAPAGSPNTDGIDPSVSRRVRISKCRIDVGDDNIAIKSGRKMAGREIACEEITVTDCVFLHGHGLSIGSETPGGVRNLTVERCVFQDTENGIRVKSPRGRGGVVENLVYRDIKMTNVDKAIMITCYYPKVPKEDPAQAVTPETPKFRNIRIENLVATCPNDAGLIVGLPESPVKDVVLQNVRITARTGLTIRNAKGVVLKDVQVEAEQGSAILATDAEIEGLK